MFRFSLALKAALESCGASRRNFCNSCEIKQAALSKYLTGRAHPKPDVLIKMAEIFPKQVLSQLYLAYVLDHIPAEALNFLTVSEKMTTPLLEEDQELYRVESKVKLPQELETAFNYLTELSIQSPTVATTITNLYRLMKNVDIDKVG